MMMMTMMVSRVDSVFVFSAIVTVLSIGIVAGAEKHDCSDITSINKCLLVFQSVIQEETLITTEAQLDRACLVMTNSTKCMEEFYKQCMKAYDKSSIDQASAMITANVKKLCEDKEYRKEYFNHLDCHKQTTSMCMPHLKSTIDFLKTGIKPDSSREEMQKQLDAICRGTVDYISCVKSSSSKTCNKEASKFIIDFEMAANQQLRRNCDPNVYKIDDAPNSAISFSNSVAMSVLSLLALVTFTRFVASK